MLEIESVKTGGKALANAFPIDGSVLPTKGMTKAQRKAQANVLRQQAAALEGKGGGGNSQSVAKGDGKGKGKGKGKDQKDKDGKPMCWEWLEKGSCSRGKDCWFSHANPQSGGGQGGGQDVDAWGRGGKGKKGRRPLSRDSRKGGGGGRQEQQDGAHVCG